MKNIFVSAYSIDKPPASTLIAALRLKGIAVEHSPRNPDDRADLKWKDWYNSGLAEALKRSDRFVVVIDEAWDSSSWMAEECHQAINSKNASRTKKTYYWNPYNVKVLAIGMAPYLKTELPAELSKAVKALTN